MTEFDQKSSPEFEEAKSAMIKRRLQDRKEWEAYWQIRYKESEGTILPRFNYYYARLFDRPVTWFREKIVEPLNDRNKRPYYHRHLDRVPEIDECGVNDKVCIYEAEEQFRLDKMVDFYIREILSQRVDDCVKFYGKEKAFNCVKQSDDYERADLNFFVKYGELGGFQTAVAAYMKQKHRLIWERRHPEIMEERRRAIADHEEKMKNGKFEMSFWTKYASYQRKKDYHPAQIYGHHYPIRGWSGSGDNPISLDWRYYKKLNEDPEFDAVNYPKKLNEMARREKEQREAQKRNNGNGDSNENGNGNGKPNGNGNGKPNGNGNGTPNGNGNGTPNGDECVCT